LLDGRRCVAGQELKFCRPTFEITLAKHPATRNGDLGAT
jgi:hypothetical protein